MNIYTEQDKNTRKTWLLMVVFLAMIIAIGFVFSQIYSDQSILYIAIIFSLIMNVVSYWYSDKIALSMSGAKPVLKKEQNPELWNVVENLSITAGLPMPKVYVIDDPSPNAFATGRNKEHAAIAVTSGLLQTMNRTELEGVIAHEMSHIGNKDILLSTVVIVLVGFIAIISDFMVRTSFRGRDDRGRGAGLFVIIGIALAILSPLVAKLIQLAISRKREYLADASGALLTRYPEGLASALEKIKNYSKPMIRTSKATAHLYISNPFGGENNVMKLFATHPPTEDRIRILRGIK